MSPLNYYDGISLDFVRACFRYEPATGKLFWKVKSTGRRACDIGDEAGGDSHVSGYVRVQIFGRMFMGHRLAWALFYGDWPPKDMHIDHINGDGGDNRISNLRLATGKQNQANRGADSTAKTSKFKGVDWVKSNGAWRARLNNRHLGMFDSEEAAARAYDAAALEEHGEFARPNFITEEINV